MVLFVLLVSIAVLLSYFSQNKKFDGLIYVSFGIFAYMMGFQDSISVDFPSYMQSFERIIGGSMKGAVFRTQELRGEATEYGWYLLNRVVGYVIPSFYAVSFLTCTFFCFSVVGLMKDVVPPKYRWVVTAFFALSPMLFFMSGLRQAVAVGCFIYAVRGILNKKKWYVPVQWLLVGMLFHNSLVVGALFLLLLLVPNKGRVFSVVVLSILFVIALFFGDRYKVELLTFSLSFFSENLDQYFYYLSEDESIAYSLRSIIRFAFPFIFTVVPMAKARSKDFYYLLFFAVGQILYALFGFMGNLQRITLYLTIFAMASFMVSSNLLKNKLVNAVFIAGNLALNAYMFYVMLSNEQYSNFLNYRTIFSIF